MNTVDAKNVEFWDELCGSTFAKKLGIVDHSAVSLRKFDDWYLDFYPYLFEHIPLNKMLGSKVLEIGLGYGTVAGQLMEAGASYHGVDIAHGPVMMVRHRAEMLGKTTTIQIGSALALPFHDATFDHVVSIGCLHHTGDLALALTEIARVTKPGGSASIMVYNALSYRQWIRSPIVTWRRSARPEFDWTNADVRSRRAYDTNLDGDAAPSTTFISPAEAVIFLSKLYGEVNVRLRNIGDDFLPARVLSRPIGRRLFERRLGLDLYINCIK